MTTDYVRPGYTRRAYFVQLWHELYTCYGRHLGSEGIAYWGWLKMHTHGGYLEALTGKAWVGRRLTARTLQLRHTKLAALDEKLSSLGLLQVQSALEIFGPKGLEELRRQAAEAKVRLNIQPASPIYTLHDPLEAGEYALWREYEDCRDCPFYRPSYCRFEVQKIAPSSPTAAALPPSPADEETLAELLAFQVEEKTAHDLCRKHPPETIREKLAWVKWQVEKGTVNNPPGFLIRALEENWLPGGDYMRHLKELEERERRQKTYAEYARLKPLEVE